MAVMAVVKLLLGLVWCYLEAFYRLLVPRPAKDIKGKVVLVTGASRGIGKCLAIQFHRRGAKLALLGRSLETVQRTADEIEAMGGVAFAYQCDVTNTHDIEKMAEKVKTQLGDVDILVNNAGFGRFRPFLDISREDLRKIVNVNLMAHFWTVQQFLPSMLERNYGHVVSIGSVAGRFGVKEMSAYCSSKFGLFGFTEALSEDIRTVYRKSGVHTTNVCPSYVQTDMLDGSASHDPRDVLDPDKVAIDVVNGVLRNEREIYLPPSMAAIDAFRALLPIKARKLFIDAITGGKN